MMHSASPTFRELLHVWTPEKVQGLIRSRTAADVEAALSASGKFDAAHLAALVSPAAAPRPPAATRRMATALSDRRGGCFTAAPITSLAPMTRSSPSR